MSLDSCCLKLTLEVSFNHLGNQSQCTICRVIKWIKCIKTSPPCCVWTLQSRDHHEAISLRPSSCQLQPGGSAGHRVSMLESLKAGLVGADFCLIVLFRAAVRWGFQQAACGQWTLQRRNPTSQGLIDPMQQRSPQLCVCSEWRPQSSRNREVS